MNKLEIKTILTTTKKENKITQRNEALVDEGPSQQSEVIPANSYANEII